MGEIMNKNYFIFAILFSLVMVFAKVSLAKRSYWGHAKERGVIVELDSDKKIYGAGDNVEVAGKIKILNRDNNKRYKGGKKWTLLDEFEENGYTVVITYPNELIVLNNNFNKNEADEDEIKFKYTLVADGNYDKPQISVKVFNNKHEISKLRRLTGLREKFQRRLILLQDLSNHYRRHFHHQQNVITYLNNKIIKLTNLIADISVKINADENLVAENSRAVFINTQQSNYNRLSTVMNRYRFLIENTPGMVVEGQKVKILASIKNLRTSQGGDDEDDNDDEFDGYKVADVKLNGQYVYTSPKKILGPNATITFEQEFSGLLEGVNTVSIELFEFKYNVRRSRIGYLTQKIYVIPDNAVPIWQNTSLPPHGQLLYLQQFPQISLAASDSLGFIDPASFVFKLDSTVGAQSNTEDLSTLFERSVVNNGATVLFAYTHNQSIPEGDYSFSAKVKDLANNYATPNPYTGQFVIDRTSPAIQFNIQNGLLTNSNNIILNATISDATPVLSKLYVNGVEVTTTNLKNFSSTINLNNEGSNLISVITQDAAGNPPTIETIEVIRDTIAPVLSNIRPSNGSNIYQMQFEVNGVANERLKEVFINGQTAFVNADGLSFTYSYLAEEQGDVLINISASDFAGNVSNYTQSVNIKNKLLNTELVMIIPTLDGLRLQVIGQSYASRPGAKINLNTGFLGLVSAQTISSSVDGSFHLEIDLFESAIIKATDLSNSQTEQANLFFDKSQTRISGIVKDSFNNPLPGATVWLSGSNRTVISDATGIFTINNPPTGDQTLVIDGSTISQAVTGPDRKFYATRVSVSIGIGQNNVVERPIYLTPLLFDNSQTVVNPTVQTVVTSVHAPGVILTVPPQTAVFPSGDSVGSISIMKIDADYSVIPTPEFALPENVYSFEPSGLSFKERVELVLPNENELPAGVELLIYSMNSSKGAWEIDGLAKVSDDGSKVVTKPGHGISHFSVIYAVPVSPIMVEAKNPNLSGVDTSAGAFTTAVQLPSFKSLGKSVTPTLQYKSSWAHPTAVTTNNISFPEVRSEFGGSFNGSKFEYQKYTKQYCSKYNEELGGCVEWSSRELQYLLGLETTFTGNIESWYEPERIRAQFFISNVATDPDNVDYYYEPNSEDKLGNINFRNNISGKINKFRGKEFNQKIPLKSQISFAVPLVNPQDNQYLKSGIYPTTSRYEITLKSMKLLTGLSITKATINGQWAGVIRTVMDDKLESEILKEAMPKDIVSSALVQSKVNSNYGRGWDFAGVQKIVNTDGGRIMLENEDGSVSTYALNNTISTVANLAETNVDFDAAVDLSNWPYAYLQRTETATNTGLIAKVDLTQGASSLSNEITIPAYAGQIASDGLYQCPLPPAPYSWQDTNRFTLGELGVSSEILLANTYKPILYGYKIKPTLGGLLRTPDGRFIALNSKQHSLSQINGGSYTNLAGMTNTVYNYMKSTTGSWRLDMNPAQINQFCNNAFGGNCQFVREQTEYTVNCSPVKTNLYIGVQSKNLSNPQNYSDTQRAFVGKWQLCPSTSYYVPSNGYTCYSGEFGDACMGYGDQLNYQCKLAGGFYGEASMPITHKNPLGDFSGNIGVAGFSGQETQSGVGTNPAAIGLNNPRGAAIGPDGSVYVADTGNNRVRKFNLSTNVVTTVAGNGSTTDFGGDISATTAGIYHPKELVFDGIGQLYISSENGYIRKVGLDGNITTIAGRPLSQGGIVGDDVHGDLLAMNNPTGMVIDKDKSYLYVADTGNHRVLRIDLNSRRAITIAGTGSCDVAGLAENSPALGASLCNPTYLGLDADKNLLIVDSGHKRIRRVVLNSGGTELTYLPTNKDSSRLVKYANGTWARTYRDGSVAYFNELGNQTSIADRIGRSISYNYNGQNLLTSIVNNVTNQTTTLSYNGSNRLSQIVDPANRITSFSYSGSNLTRVEFPDGTSKRFEYDDLGLMTSQINERNVETEYTYNEYSRIAKIKHADGTEIETQDSFSKTANNTDNDVNILPVGFNPTEVHDSIIDAKDIQTQVTKDFMGLVSKIKDAEGRVTEIQKDIEGKTKKIIAADGTVTEFSYNETNNDLLSVKNVNLNIIESQTYNQYGQIVTQTNANNETKANTYNSIGQLTRETLPNGSTIDYTYDPTGQVKTKTVKPNSSTTLIMQYEYDALGNLSKVIDNAGNTVSYTYDSAGNKLQNITKPNGVDDLITNYTYNNANQILSVQNPKNEITSYEYLTTGELEKIKDPNNNEVIFEYDLKGRLKKKTNADATIHQFSYDANNNRTQETDPNGQIKNYVYNNLNQLVQVNLPDDNVFYDYDVRGEIAKAQNSNSMLEFIRDPKGRVTQTGFKGLNALSSLPEFTQNYDYDYVGNLLSMQSGFGNLFYSYNGNNQLTALSNSWGDNFSFNYDDTGRLTRVVRPNGYSDFSYHNSGQLASIEHRLNGVIKSFNQYQYDQRNFITQKTTQAAAFEYQYDNNSQLVSATNPSGSTENFSYDNLGNRLSDNSGSYDYDSKFQKLQSDALFNYFYDNNGNLIRKYPKDTTKPAYKYTYSSTNQLVKFEVLENMAGQVIKRAEYKYDVLGRRIQKQVVDLQNSSASYTRRYLYNGDNIFVEMDEDNDVLARYTHSPLSPDDLLGADITSDGQGAGLAQSSGKYFALKDHLNSITDFADSSGQVVQSYQYASFGKIFSIKDGSGNDITSNPRVSLSFTYTGRELDSESGMYYYRARYYDPSTGRFLQQDPDPGKLNDPITFLSKYIYANNNPIMKNDPSGKFAFLAAIAWAAVYSAGITAIQAGIITNWGQDGDFWKAFQGNFAVNFAFTLVGISFAAYNGAKAFEIGWGGVYSTADLGGKYGFSLGFFQSIPGSTAGSAFYWHEVGHAINFGLSGFFNDPENGSYWGTIGYLALTLPGTGPLEHKLNPISWTGEGSASAWGRLFSGEWYGFPH